MEKRFDAIVIGTGFAGSVTACRLVQAGFNICVLERGRRYEKSDFPRFTPPGPGELPDLSRLLWNAGHGLWELRDLHGIEIGQAAGYGGGSLIYASVHLRAPDHVFKSGWPTNYSRAALEDYYDLAAYMLQLSRIDDQQFQKGQVPKTALMEEIATALGRNDQFFHTPVAIHFNGPGDPQPAGPRRRTREPCKGCGDCVIGCANSAKNTLDVNYLAIAEDALNAAGKPYADIRTMAEVVEIRPIDARRPKGGYRVTYEDHLCSRDRVEVEAPWVFLCAGAVNSTEILFKCRESGALPRLGTRRFSRQTYDALGKRYFANADALAVAYDGQRAFQPECGPTITTALLYRRDAGAQAKGGAARRDGNARSSVRRLVDPTEPAEWFLLQEGGYPPLLAPVFGVFRAPLWVGRNRFFEQPDGRRYFELARLLRGVLNRNHGSDVSASLSWVNDRVDVLLRRVPPRLGRVFEDLRAEAAQALPNEIAAAFADGVIQRVTRWPVVGPLFGAILNFLRPGLQWLLAKPTTCVVRELLGADRAADRIVALVFAILGIGKAEDKTAVFLVMGRDDTPGELVFKNDVLCMHFDDLAADRVYTVEEQLMRDCVQQLDRVSAGNGKRNGPRAQLRLNPAWSLFNRPITVHSQGGCAMAEKPGDGVTNRWGQVHGYPGLYVMDAAIFPRSVGVNPAATITAIAERNIERHLRKNGHPDWRAPDWTVALPWARARRAILDPIREIEANLGSPGVKEPDARPIGLRFHETMQGFHAAEEPGLSYERAAEIGRVAHTSIRADLHADVEDLARMLAERKHEIALAGTITLNTQSIDGTPGSHEYGAFGRLRLLVRSNRGSPTRDRRMYYMLHFGPGGRYYLSGVKILLERPGSDLWRDATTLYVRFRGPRVAAAPGRRVMRRKGILRVGLSDFLETQLPSFEVTGTQDEERIAWAMGAFGSFFLGNLAKAYLPETHRTGAFA